MALSLLLSLISSSLNWPVILSHLSPKKIPKLFYLLIATNLHLLQSNIVFKSILEHWPFESLFKKRGLSVIKYNLEMPHALPHCRDIKCSLAERSSKNEIFLTCFIQHFQFYFNTATLNNNNNSSYNLLELVFYETLWEMLSKNILMTF